MVIGALLHDTLEIVKEDKQRLEKEKEKIESKFGKDILELTLNVSTDFYKGRTYYDQLQKMFNNFKKIKRKDNDRETFLRVNALLIKLADSCDNIETVYARRRYLYSEMLEFDKISKSKNKEADLKIDSHRKMIKNSIHFLNAVNKHLNKEGNNYLNYSGPINSLYKRFRDSLTIQIQNDLLLNLKVQVSSG